MDTKPLLYGLIGFFIGGLLVSMAATTFDKPEPENSMTASLENKTGDEFDKAFIAEMIGHHKGAVEMAKLSEGQARHSEIKDLSKAIISAQETEISQMKKWQKDWGYEDSSQPDHSGGH